MVTQVTLTQFRRQAQDLAVKIRAQRSRKPYTGIYGIPSGGIPLAIELSHLLKLTLLDEPGNAQVTLVVDDVIDSGRTIAPFIARGYDVATLYAKEQWLEDRPSRHLGVERFYAEILRDYVVFPWEQTGMGSPEPEQTGMPPNELETETSKFQTGMPLKKLELEIFKFQTDFASSAAAASGPEDAVRRILQFMGYDPNEPDFKETPRRVLERFNTFSAFSAVIEEPLDAATFEGVVYDGMILVKAIPIVSLCRQHLLPFSGRATVAYIPSSKDHVLRLSDLALLVQQRARRLQNQQQKTSDIAESVARVALTSDVAVLVETAEHEHESKVSGPLMVTTSTLGAFGYVSRAREEFMHLARSS